MNTPEKIFRVDIGGGPDLLPGHGSWGRVMESIHNLRATKLAKTNPAINYVVLDMHIPRSEAQFFHKGYPNLHFVEHKIAEPTRLPFRDASVDRVEINHMWTALAAQTAEYIHVLRESGRILKSDGVLSITEKEAGINKILILLSNNSFPDLDVAAQVLTKITEPRRSYYSQLAFPQENEMYCLKLRKK